MRVMGKRAARAHSCVPPYPEVPALLVAFFFSSRLAAFITCSHAALPHRVLSHAIAAHQRLGRPDWCCFRHPAQRHGVGNENVPPTTNVGRGLANVPRWRQVDKGTSSLARYPIGPGTCLVMGALLTHKPPILEAP